MSDSDKKRGASKSAATARAERDSLLETMESLVVAFILAFVFRAYVVEAFVIPTGSMAPRLLGDHFELTCSNCGYRYDVDIPDNRPAGDAPRTIYHCPLCHDTEVTQQHNKRYFGDRILALKYYYDLFPPDRWDVIIFKYPIDPTQNYIKRLIGLPGDTVEIVDGDVTINGEIAHKTDTAQDALWMPVADTAFWDANNGSRWRPLPGGPDGLWNWQEMPQAPYRFTPRGQEMAYLQYHHLDARGRPIAIRDFYAYDNTSASEYTRQGDPQFRHDSQNIVTDLQLVAELEIDGPGVVELVLTAWADTFTFRLPSEGMNRQAQILHNGAVLAQGRTDPLPVGRRVTVEAANVDHKLVLRLNGCRVIDTDRDGDLDPADDPIYEPTHAGGRAEEAGRLRIGAAGAATTVYRLKINRDIYYTSRMANSRGGGYGTEGNPYTLDADEFFVLGDNSPRSQDSRWWSLTEGNIPAIFREGRDPDDAPVVPRRNLVGKAFFVYWPAAGARYGVPDRLRFVPDVTEFRFIR